MNLTIKQVHKGLINKEFSCVELTKNYLDEIKKQNKKLNTFLTITDDLALSQAKKVDKKISNGERISKLEGIPIAVKDNMLVKDYNVTAGSKILENYKATYDGTVVSKIKQAGMVILGKTNLDEFAMGSSTEHSHFGPTKNPHDINRVPGGSSGGSAAAVAADQCVVALGSDTGGSVRQPASLCGVFGFKPSYGAVSRYGLIAMASSLDQIGPITKTPEDAQLVFNAIKGNDPLDSTGLDLKDQTDKLKVENLRIGVPKEYFAQGVDKNVKEKVNQAIDKFKQAGAKVKQVSLPNSKYALAAYYIIMPSEVSANLARYDGIKYGFRAKAKNLLDSYLKTRAQGFGDEIRRRIMLGTYALSSGYWEAYYGKAQKVRRLIKQDFDKIFSSKNKNGVDIILTPTSPSVAFKFGQKKDPLTMYLSDIYTVPVNLAGLPAASISCGTANNLPVGLQMIGPQFKDSLVLETAKLYNQTIS